LLIGPLNEIQKKALEIQNRSLNPTDDSDHILSLPRNEFIEAVGQLSQLGVEVKQTLAGKMSLEDLFVQTVKESKT
jgi:hypothetical protein